MSVLQNMALFAAVAQQRSFSRAAEQLGIPNSTLSRRIKALEAELGLQLLNRSTRQVELTDAGEVYFRRCQAILEQAEQAQDELMSLKQQARGLVRISATIDFAQLYLTPALTAFARHYPEIQFELDLSAANRNLASEQLDVVFRIGRLPDSALIGRYLMDIQLALYAAPMYIQAKGEPQTPSDLQQHSCIYIAAERPVWQLFQQKQQETIPLQGRFALNNIGMMQQLCVLGEGIAALPTDLVEAALAAGQLQRILPAWSLAKLPVHILTSSRLQPARVRLLLEFMLDYFKTQRAPL